MAPKRALLAEEGRVTRAEGPGGLEKVFAKEGSRLTLAGGAQLVTSGETVEALYRVSAGRLAEFEPTADGGRLQRAQNGNAE